MPELNDDTIETADDGVDGGDSGSGSSGESTSTDPKSAKRISDLQSLADKETARANKAEAAYQRMLAAAKEPEAGPGKPDAGNASVNTDVLDMARMFVFQTNPKLEEYGVEMSEITGSTPQEIATNAAALVAKFDKIASITRNKVLADNGLSAEISSGEPPKGGKRDFTNMSKEDFDALVERSLSGQRP